MSTTWRHYELGARVRKIAGDGEERLGLDRLSGKPVTLRVYPRPRSGTALPPPLPQATDGRPTHLAQPLELIREEDETIVARDLAFGPTLEDLLQLGPQPSVVVAALLRQLLDGLAGLHAAGRVHLRLSPAAVRFDLLAGVLKVIDLEQSLVESEPPDDLIPRYLEPEVRGGNGRPLNDVYSVGRIGEALLRGSAPLGAWGGSGVGPGPLWDFVQRCQSPSTTERPQDAGEALTQLGRLGLPQAPALALPLGSFVRRHVRALRELRRWRAQPLPPFQAVARTGSLSPARGYRELLSSGQAARLWAVVGFAALCFVAATAAVAQSPRQGSQSSSGIPSDTCEADARPTDLAPGAALPEGKVAIELEVRAGQTVAIDGCLLRAEVGQPLHLAITPGTHAFRAIEDATGLVETRDVHPDQKFSFSPKDAPSGGVSDPVALLVSRLKQGVAADAPDGGPMPAMDPLETGLLDPASRVLLASVHDVLDQHPELDSALPVSLGLGLDGLRAAERRFIPAAAPCESTLAKAAAEDLAAGAPEVDRPVQLAAELLAVTRIRGGELREPLRTEREGLARLQVVPSHRLLTTVEQLASRPEIVRCLSELAPKAAPLNVLSGLAIGQLPGVQLLEQDPERDDSP